MNMGNGQKTHKKEENLKKENEVDYINNFPPGFYHDIFCTNELLTTLTGCNFHQPYGLHVCAG